MNGRQQVGVVVGTSLVAALAATLDVAFVRLPLGLLAVLALPGYALTLAIFPWDHLDTVERSALAIPLSITMLIIVAPLLDGLPSGLDSGAILGAIVALTLGISALAYWRLGPITSPDVDAAARGAEPAARSWTLERIRAAITTVGKKYRPGREPDTSFDDAAYAAAGIHRVHTAHGVRQKGRLSTDRGRFIAAQTAQARLRVASSVIVDQRSRAQNTRRIVAGILASMTVAIGSVGIVVAMSGEPDRRTEFYVLGPGSIAEGYPTVVEPGQIITVAVAIRNHEDRKTRYRIVVESSATELLEVGPIELDAQGAWTGDVQFALPRAGIDQEIRISLLRNNASQPYRSLRLWADVVEGI